MATLTEVSYYTRRLIKWGALVFFILLISPAVIKGIGKLYLILRPPPPAAPTVKYGKLPKLSFPETDSTYTPTYRLQTIDGQLPKLPTIARVYLVQINQSRLLAVDRIKPKARVLGFTDEPEELEDSQTFKFTNPVLQATLTANVISEGLHYRLAWQGDQTLLAGQVATSNDQLLMESRSFLQNLGLLASDLADGPVKYLYYKADASGLSPAASLSEANFVRVDIFRSPKDELSFASSGGDKSAVSLLFSSSSDRNKRIVEMDYQYSKVLSEDFATYPLKGVETAWAQLQQGQGAVIQQGNGQEIIRKAWLSYYESEQPQQFLQPVYVFSGDNNFLGFVPAVDAKYSE